MRRLVALGFIWGWSFLFIKVAVDGLSPSTVAWARISLGALVLHAIRLRQGGVMPLDRTTLRHLTIAALFGNAMPFTMLAWAEQHITSALTAVLNAATPLFTALFAAIVLSERLRWAQRGGLFVGIVGVSLAAGLGAGDVTSSSMTGAAGGIGAACCYGIAFVYMRKHLMGIPPVVAAAGQLTAGSLLLVPLALATSLNEGVSLTPTRVVAVLLLGAVGTGIAYAMLYRANAELGPTKASLVTYIVPVVAVVVGVLVLDEPFTWQLIVGGLLTVGGIAGVTLTRKPAPPKPAPATVTPAVAEVN